MLGFVASANARPAPTMYWASVDVKAHLNADGSMDVVERQAIVFDGPWNGGERHFAPGFGARVQLLGMRRIDPATGKSIALTPGPLTSINHYRWVKRNLLAWSSRLSSDPPFDHTKLVYELHYRLSDFLVPLGDRTFRFEHDFAFRNRPGEIRHFSLVFSSDLAWSLPITFPRRIVREDLLPHQGVVGRFKLSFHGAGWPMAALRGVPTAQLLLAGALFLTFLAWRLWSYVLVERRSGRFAPVSSLDEIDEAWLQREVFFLLPEQVGALSGDRSGAATVAAVLARLVQEGKLASQLQQRDRWPFRRPVLELRLVQPREQFTGYERKLVDFLFVDGESINTMRLHHSDRSSRGAFESLHKITETPMRKPVERVPERRVALGASLLTAGFWFFGIGALAVLAYQGPNWLPLAVSFVAFAAGDAVVMYALAFSTRDEVDHPLEGLLAAGLVWLLFIVPLIVLLALFYLYVPLLAWVGVMCIELAAVNGALQAAHTRQGADRIARRKQLCAARRFFIAELRRPEPHLQDAWFPYLLAFGLARSMDRWFRTQRAGGSSNLVGGNGVAVAWAVAAKAVARTGSPMPTEESIATGSTRD